MCYFWGSFGTIEGTIYFSSVSIREIPHYRLYIQGNRNAHKLKRITFDDGWELRIKVMRTRGYLKAAAEEKNVAKTIPSKHFCSFDDGWEV